MVDKIKRIFSGENSVKLWKEINAIQSRYPLIWNALYSLGCRCQELEQEVFILKERLNNLSKEG